MKLFPEDPVFEIGKVGFDDRDAQGRKSDLLDRKSLGQKLTDLVDRINQPLVIALDGGWGSGKSHFLKLWTGAHSKELGGQAEVIYFDAFEHDYLDDPLVSLISRLIVQGETKTWSAAALEKVKKTAFPLARGLLRTGVALVTAGISEATGPVVDAVIGKVGEVTEDQIGDFWKQETGRIAAMAQFKKALEALTLPKADGDGLRKIVFIVDELDRCRPDYALSLLEIIKHFFAVSNVHFVLGVNLEALENSVKARYGVGINAAVYLQKFIRVRLSLPRAIGTNIAARNELICFDFYAHDMGLAQDFQQTFRSVLSPICLSRNVSLRDVQQIVTHLALLATSFGGIYVPVQVVIYTSLICKVLTPNFYPYLRDGSATFDQFCRNIPLAMPLEGNQGREQGNIRQTWEYLLAATPSISADKFGEGWFGPLNIRDRRNWLRSTIREHLETFSVPALPSS